MVREMKASVIKLFQVKDHSPNSWVRIHFWFSIRIFHEVQAVDVAAFQEPMASSPLSGPFILASCGMIPLFAISESRQQQLAR